MIGCLALAHPHPKRAAVFLEFLTPVPQLDFFVQQTAVTPHAVQLKTAGRALSQPRYQSCKQQSVGNVFALIAGLGRADIRSCTAGPLWRCTRTFSLVALCYLNALRVPSGQRTSVHCPGGGLKRHPPVVGTATYAGSMKPKAGNFVQLQEPDPAVCNPDAPPFGHYKASVYDPWWSLCSRRFKEV